MGRALVLLLLFVAASACAGQQIPTHNGYKGGDKAKPWKKAKTLKFDDENEAKAEGTLSYPDMKRAAWFGADLKSAGQLDLKLEITPPGEAVNEDFDLGFEVLDPGNRVIARSDLTEGEDTYEFQKSKTLLDLEPGKYLIHLYLQSRLDSADYELRAVFKPMASVGKSDFPAQVAFLPTLPMVPLTDDTPRSYRPPSATVVTVRRKKRGPKTPPPTPTPAAAAPKSARIINLQVVSGGTQITIGIGTSGGVSAGMNGKINNVASGAFTIGACNERTCTATVKATPDQIKGGGSVTITP
jgi:hypothetical protein